MTASEFLHELKKEHLTGREFLALIGHTDISNEDYTEIKENPLMTYSRLVEILEKSPIYDADYVNLIKTARERREKQAQKKKREDLETRLTSILAGEKEKVEDVTEEISLDSVTDDVSVYSATTVDDLWDSENEDGGSDSLDEFDEFDEYGGDKDFDKTAHRENLPKIIICLSLGFVLLLSSFVIRYMTTGSWGVSNFAHKGPQSYEEVFTFQSGKSARGSIADMPAVYRAENFTEPQSSLSLIAASNNFLFKISGNSVRAAEIDSGMMSDAPSFTPEADSEILGIFEQNKRLYVVCADSYTVAVEIEDDDFLKFSQPQITVYEFDAVEFTGIPATEYRIDGSFKEVILHTHGFFVIGDYAPSNDTNTENYTGYIPAYSTNGEEKLIEIENIEFIRDAPYSNMTVIASVSRDNFTMYSVSGNSADGVCFSSCENGGSLIMSFYNERKNESRILRYNIFGSVLNNPIWGSVAGKVKRGFIDERERLGIIRVVSDLGNTAVLNILDNTNLNSVARLGNVPAADGGVVGAAFDEKTAYVVANQPPKAYAICTSNPSRPAFLNEVNALISDREFYPWGDNHFFAVEVDTDNDGSRQGIMITMYRQAPQSGSAPLAESVYKLPIRDAVWHDYTKTAAEDFREAVASSRDSGVIVVPVTYFNAVTRVESFFALNYIESNDGGEFIEMGKITEMGFNTRLHAAIINGGYIYTLWDDMVRSAATDLTMIASHDLRG
jgi:hypothetical protein